MKKLIAIPLMLLVLVGFSQDTKIGLVQSPGSYDDGFSFGLSYEHQSGIVYYGAELYAFPGLHDLPYYHLIGRFGFKHEFELLMPMRIFAGVRGGLINRDGSFGYALMGVESGINFYLFDPFFLGLSVAIDNKTDSKIWGSESYHTVRSGLITLGIRL